MPALEMKTSLSVFEPPKTALSIQKKPLHAFATFVKLIMELMAIVMVVSTWKINCPLTLLPALRMSVPVRLL